VASFSSTRWSRIIGSRIKRAGWRFWTIGENLLLGAASRRKGHWTLDTVYKLFPVLRERRDRMGTELSGGQQQMLAVGRALLGNPRVLLLDEPSEGLAPQIVREVGEALLTLKSQMSILLVEQNLGLALKVADDVVILNTGRVVFSGTRETFLAQQASLNSHLGVE